MLNNLKEFLRQNRINIRGWSTRRELLIIESDDWGSIRMPDKTTFNKLLSGGVRVDKCPLCTYDSIESEDDLKKLYEVLYEFVDPSGNHPVFTANCVVANPDFVKIRETNFKEYHYESLSVTLKSYPRRASVLALWGEGIRHRLFYPQFHGREHLNVSRWMKALRSRWPETLFAFNLGFYGVSTDITKEQRKSYLEAFAADSSEEEIIIGETIEEGLKMFATLTGYAPKSFIAPNYVWSSGIEEKFSIHNVNYIQGQRIQFSPSRNKGGYSRISHFVGDRNYFEQIYLVRNCYFEPSIYPTIDSVDRCLAQISNAFQWNRPAIITSHRVNYIGSLDNSNREKNLDALKLLLTRVQNEWPDVEFLTSDELGDVINTDFKKNGA